LRWHRPGTQPRATCSPRAERSSMAMKLG